MNGRDRNFASKDGSAIGHLEVGPVGKLGF